MEVKALVSMANPPKMEVKETVPEPYEPKYPYGLCLSLDEDSMAKLGIEGDADVGDGIEFVAKAKVTSASATEKSDGSVCRRVELQITHMALGASHEERKDNPRYG